jgi:2-succinyl-6-hydroxy-2,4-cyclohexadiene-1-carboxylate synthase
VKIVEVHGIGYCVREQGYGFPLLLLHGFTGSSANWSSLIPAFPKRYRIIAVDLLGHGCTDAPADESRYRIEQAAADLEALMIRLNATPAHVLGYSMGGRLALYLALTRPYLARSLILESASPGMESEEQRIQRRSSDEQLAGWIEANGIGAFVEYWEQLLLFASQGELPADVRLSLREQRLENRPCGLANSLRGMGTGAQPSLWPCLGKLLMPALLLAGALDGKFTAINERMASLIPRATLSVIDSAGHTTHLEQPAAFVGAIRKFLNEINEGQSSSNGSQKQ